MKPTAKDLLRDALKLPDIERAELAALLIDSLEIEMDEDAGSAWHAEIEQRLSQFDNDSVTPIPWSEARRMILEKPSDQQ